MTVSRTICLGFLSIIIIGTILLLLPWSTTEPGFSNPITALFTATSAVCVTGLIVEDTGTYYTGFGQLVIVILIQLGGLGYMTASTFLLLLLGRKFRLKEKLAIQQSLDRPGMAGVLYLVKSIIATTLIVEITGIMLLMLVFSRDYGQPLALWLSVFHSISAFNNAGFSVFSDSLVQYARSPLVNLVITLLIIIGGIGYQVMMESYYWMRARLSGSSERRVFSLHFKIATTTTIFLLVFGTLIFLITEFSNPNTWGSFNFGEKVLAAWFQSVTTRTAGFNTIDIGQMTSAGLYITILLMFIGASPGSTGGGIKTTTFRVLLNTAQTVVQGRQQVLSYQRQIPIELVFKSVGVIITSILIVMAGTIMICISDPNISAIQILFEVVSAFATVGLSTGITASLSGFAKLILILIMYVGRVGLLLILNAIIGEVKPTNVRYPEEELLVG